MIKSYASCRAERNNHKVYADMAIRHTMGAFALLITGHGHHMMAGMSGTATSLSALMAAMFLGGFAGSLTHCAPMCGPFVLAQVAANFERVPANTMNEFTRLKGAALVPYHLGRFTTYSLLGAIAASLMRGIAEVTAVHWAGAVLLGIAAVIFLAQGLGRGLPLVSPSLANFGGARFFQWLAQWLGKFAQPLIANSTRPGARYLLGVVLGFLPCGLLYGALAAAATAGGALAGGLAMASFTLGTVPALVTVGAMGEFLLKRHGAAVRTLAAVLMVVNAATLAYLAVQAVS